MELVSDREWLSRGQLQTTDGSGAWIVGVPDREPSLYPAALSLGGINGAAAIVYGSIIDGGLKVAQADPLGGWTIITLAAGDPSYVPNLPIGLTIVNGTPAITFFDNSQVVSTGNYFVKLARNSAADGSGAWNMTTVDTLSAGYGDYGSTAVLNGSGAASIAYHEWAHSDLKWASVVFPATMVVEQPAGTNIPNNGGASVTAVTGSSTSITFTIRNNGNANLTGLTITKDGTDAADFIVPVNPTSPIAPGASATFILQFNPATAGTKNAAFHIASNDPAQNPFNILLTGNALSFTQDTDGDGMNDASEFQLASLGYNWQVAQTALVNALSNNIGSTGIVQSLYVNEPLISKNPSTGQFKLTIGVQKTTNLSNSYAPFPMSAPQTTLNGSGELEFQFSTSDPAAFFRLQAR